jgi:hypothetical protein
MKDGDVIRFALQQHDGKYLKRPAVIIKKLPQHNDFIICGISKSIGLALKEFDIVLSRDNPDFKTWGLDYPGVIRIGFLFTISGRYIEGALGKISADTHGRILKNLSALLAR